MKRNELAGLVDAFGRTADAPVQIGELFDWLDERAGEKVDEDLAVELAASSSYLFESWEDPLLAKFIPRRRFFQAAEFRITPLKEEVEGGFLFPGHRFMPFICREVFPADVWLLLPDGAVPHVKRIEYPMELAMKSLCFFGDVQAMEYLGSDDPANMDADEAVSVSVFDLREFFLENNFKPGDSIMVKVLDWLQGVCSISHAPADGQIADARDWTAAMRSAYERMLVELGADGDCYEQFAIMLLLGTEDARFPILNQPPLSIAAFFNLQNDVVVKPLADRAVLCAPDAQSVDESFDGLFGEELDDLMTPLDAMFRELGLSMSESEAEAYMRDALFRGLNNPDAVLARIFTGRPILFSSADAQEEFHQLWNELWLDVVDMYSRAADPHGKLRSDLLALNDRCIAVIRGMDAKSADPRKLADNPDFRDFGMLTGTLSGLVGLLNIGDEDWQSPMGNLDTIASVLFDKLPGVLEKLESE